jgi:SAM-dependent methyltransferase
MESCLMSDSRSDDVKAREKEHHEQRYATAIDPRRNISQLYEITAASKDYWREMIRSHVSAGSRLLEYGCGSGQNLEFCRTLPGSYFGIDISEAGIQKARQSARLVEFDATYQVADAESTGFPSGYFDVVMGSGIIHHLDVAKSMSELSRITKPTGCCIFFEAMGHNVFLRIFRALTPKVRSPDEHPLLESDFETMRRHFRRVEPAYFHLIGLAAAPFRATSLFVPMAGYLSRIDERILRRFRWLRKHSWICVIKLSEPIGAEVVQGDGPGVAM